MGVNNELIDESIYLIAAMKLWIRIGNMWQVHMFVPSRLNGA
jgi:hypothetical protein